MRSMPRSRLAGLAAVVVILAAASSRSAPAQIAVTPTVTPVGGEFHYDYSIGNNSGQDIYLVDIAVGADPSVVQNLVAPSGFQAAFDPGLGLVSFLEDTSVFGAAPVDGFAFDSPTAPGRTTFFAHYVDGNSVDNIIFGPTAGPVPEPGVASVALAAALGAVVARRKRTRLPGPQTDRRVIRL